MHGHTWSEQGENTPRSSKNTCSNAVLNQSSPEDEVLQLSCAEGLLWALISSGNPV